MLQHMPKREYASVFFLATFMQLQGAQSLVVDIISAAQSRLHLQLHRQPLNVTVVDMKPSGASCIR